MSYASEEQWKPTGIYCPICGHESLALGDNVKHHTCIPDFMECELEQFVRKQIVPHNLVDMTKRILHVI